MSTIAKLPQTRPPRAVDYSGFKAQIEQYVHWLFAGWDPHMRGCIDRIAVLSDHYALTEQGRALRDAVVEGVGAAQRGSVLTVVGHRRGHGALELTGVHDQQCALHRLRRPQEDLDHQLAPSSVWTGLAEAGLDLTRARQWLRLCKLARLVVLCGPTTDGVFERAIRAGAAGEVLVFGRHATASPIPPVTDATSAQLSLTEQTRAMEAGPYDGSCEHAYWLQWPF